MKKKFLKLLIFVLTITIGFFQVDAAQTSNVDDWLSLAGNTSNSKKTNARTPISSEYMQETKVVGGFREPIVINDLIYIVNASGKKEGGSGNQAMLEVYNRDGVRLKYAELATPTGYFSRLTYGDGKIFVPLANQIQAFDAKTLESLWLSPFQKGEQIISSITYYNGYIYSGTAIPKGASADPSDGFFFALSTKDEDNSKKDEIKNYAWTWSKPDKIGSGFYWANAAIVKNSIVFVGDGGYLVSHHLTKDIVLDELNLSNFSSSKESHKVRSSIYYDRNKDELLVGTQNSKMMFSIKMSGNTFNHKNVKAKDAFDQISGGVAATDTRIYLPSGGMLANAFSVLDRGFNEIYSTIQYGTQSYPLVSTAYGKNKLIYFIDYRSGKLIIVTDDGTNNLKFAEHSSLTLKGYNSNGIVTNSYGDLIVPNYGGNLAIIKNTADKMQVKEIEDLIAALPKVVEYSDREIIESTKVRYDNFMVGNSNAKVSNKNELLNKVERLDDIAKRKVSDLNNKIANIPTNFSDEATATEVYEIEIDYHMLDQCDKGLITNYNKLINAVKIADDIFDEGMVEDLIEKIDQIPTSLSLDNEQMVKELKKRYDSLAEYIKKSVTNSNKLISASDKIEKQRTQVNDIKNGINSIPAKITLKQKDLITNLMNRYNALSAINKKYVNQNGAKNYEYLKECSEKITDLVNVKVISIKSGNTTNYYKYQKRAWVNIKRVVVSNNVTHTYTYKYAANKVTTRAAKPGNGALLAQRYTVTKRNKKIIRKQTYNYNNFGKVTSNNLYVLNKKNKFVNTYRNTRTYYPNKRLRQNYIIKRNLNTSKVTYKQLTKYRANGKKSIITTHKLKKGRLVKSVKKYR